LSQLNSVEESILYKAPACPRPFRASKSLSYAAAKMGSSARKKAEKKKDFQVDPVPLLNSSANPDISQKPKYKVGKDKPKASNFTDTSFKAKCKLFRLPSPACALTQLSHCDGPSIPLNRCPRCRPTVQAHPIAGVVFQIRQAAP